MTLSEIRQNARESLSNKWGTAALLMLVFSLIEFGISFVYAILNYIPFFSLIAYVGLITISIPIYFGLVFCFIELKNGNQVECIDYFKFGFSNFKRVWCITGNILKKLWLYLLLYVVVAFLMGFGSVFMIAFAVAMESTIIAIFSCLTVFILVAALIAILVLLTIKSYLYVLVPYIAWDNPALSAKDVVEKSETLMIGHRGEYFLLYLSFIGWSILSMFTFGIGLLWLIPYIHTSYIIFYENRIKESGNNDNNDDNSNKIEAGNEPNKIEEASTTEIIENTEDVENIETFTNAEIVENPENIENKESEVSDELETKTDDTIIEVNEEDNDK